MGQPTRKRAAPAAIPLSLQVFGAANGVPLDVAGKGRIDRARKRCDLTLSTASAPLDLDPLLVVLAVVDVVLLPLLSVKPADPGVPAVGYGAAVVIDEDGRWVGSLTTTTVVQATGREFRARVQVRSCDVVMEPSETITRAELGRVLVDPAACQALVAAGWSVETTRGRTYRLAGSRLLADAGGDWRCGGAPSVQAMLGLPEGGTAGRTLSLAMVADP